MSSSRSFSVASGVAVRSARKIVSSPVGPLSQMAIPLFFFAAFTGALSNVGSTPGFKYYDFTAFEFVFVLYQSAMFAGVFTGIEMAIDYGSGMANRLMLSAPQRPAIIAGFVAVSLARAVLGVAVFWVIALAVGMPVRGDAAQIAGLTALALLLNVATTLWGAGIALRFRTIESAALITIPTFMVMFLSPVFVTRDKLSGWLQTAASVNPFTSPLESGRGLLAGQPVRTGLAFAVTGALVLVFAIWALRGMQKAEHGSGSSQRPRRGPLARRAAA